MSFLQDWKKKANQAAGALKEGSLEAANATGTWAKSSKLKGEVLLLERRVTETMRDFGKEVYPAMAAGDTVQTQACFAAAQAKIEPLEREIAAKLKLIQDLKEEAGKAASVRQSAAENGAASSTAASIYVGHERTRTSPPPPPPPPPMEAGTPALAQPHTSTAKPSESLSSSVSPPAQPDSSPSPHAPLCTAAGVHDASPAQAHASKLLDDNDVAVAAFISPADLEPTYDPLPGAYGIHHDTYEEPVLLATTDMDQNGESASQAAALDGGVTRDVADGIDDLILAHQKSAETLSASPSATPPAATPPSDAKEASLL